VPEEKAVSSNPRQDDDFVSEPFVRRARPVQLEEADWVLDECTTWPVDEESHPRSLKACSGTLSNDPEGERLPVVESGVSIDPEDLGVQFLRNATEQDNFESTLEGRDVDPTATALEQVISEASLETSAQAGFAVPESGALGGRQDRERALEPRTGVVDLVSRVVREASLFDQPTEEGETRAPMIFADEQKPTKLVDHLLVDHLGEELRGAQAEEVDELELDELGRKLPEKPHERG
jgi:hypothetical protein